MLIHKSKIKRYGINTKNTIPYIAMKNDTRAIEKDIYGILNT